MKFYHKVSKPWLEARQCFLTASDIRKIIPLTATGRPRKVTDDMYMDVLAPKLVKLTDDACESYGAAARGHLLEKWALDEYNWHYALDESAIMLYHWDDMLLSSWSEFKYPLAFSPDGLDIFCTTSGVFKYSNELKKQPKFLGEVKSYGPERYLKAVLKDPMELEERWQIATAMATIASIEDAVLILYNPDMHMGGLCLKEFDREMLFEEIEMIKEAEKNFNEWAFETEMKIKSNQHMLHYSTEQVYENVLLNPGCEA